MSSKASFIKESELHYYYKVGQFQRLAVGVNRIGFFQSYTGGWTTQFAILDSYTWNRGYITLLGELTDPINICVFVHGGTLVLNKQIGQFTGQPYEYDIYRNYVIFRNGVTIDGYTSTDLNGLTEENDQVIINSYTSTGLNGLIEENDQLTILFANKYTDQGRLLHYTIGSSIYNDGYIQLPEFNHLVAFVVAGGTLVESLDYVLHDTYFIFRNGITVDGYTSSGLLETLQIGDIIHIIVS